MCPGGIELHACGRTQKLSFQRVKVQQAGGSQLSRSVFGAARARLSAGGRGTDRGRRALLGLAARSVSPAAQGGGGPLVAWRTLRVVLVELVELQQIALVVECVSLP